MMNASMSTWNKMMDTYIKNPEDKVILCYLACSEDPEILINYLNTNDSAVDDPMYGIIFVQIILQHANKDPIFDSILANIEHITSR